MCLKGYYQQQPKLRSFRRLMYLSPVITILSLTLLLWNYRPARTIKFWSQYYQPTSLAQIPVQRTLPTGSGPGRQDPHGQKVPLVAVNGTHTLLVSAYLEHRTNRREVHVIAVVLRSETVAYRCLLCCQGQCHISAGDASTHMDHFGFAYGTATILCPLPSGCETPSHIAVTSVAAADSEDKGEVFLEVLNQEARSDSFPHTFTVCLSTMFNFTNVLQLVQSMEVLKLLGVSRVVVYKTSCSPDTQRLLDYYIHTGFMEVIPWSKLSKLLNVSPGWQREIDPGDLHYYGQIPALNDCVYRYMYQSKYLALHDMDELILPQSVDSWREMLPLLEQKHGADFGYMFENAVFPNTIKLPPPTSHTPQHPQSSCCTGWQGVSGVNILAHLYHEPLNQKEFSNFKIIINPRAVFAPTVHGLLNSQKGCVRVDSNVALMYHTRPPVQTKLTTDQLVYDDRLLGYSVRLILAVNKVLRETGLMPEDNTE
uniref:uncharacterized protein n=1 Tax=Centroberyx gerrardi TaxID=166262 RepID=UPI003AAFC590